jgi:D-arabinose 1-dehydrogenase-like Zn-dependent alcohol dehydrogenase
MNYTLQKLSSSMHYILLDAKTVAKLTKDGNKRVICTINKTEKLHAAIMPKKDGGHFVIIGSSICKKLKLKVGAEIEASFVIDKTEYQFAMPEELKEVLDTDEEANKIFHALTAGNQRGLIYLLGLVKSSDKKIERALKIAERIKLGIVSPRLVLK